MSLFHKLTDYIDFVAHIVSQYGNLFLILRKLLHLFYPRFGLFLEKCIVMLVFLVLKSLSRKYEYRYYSHQHYNLKTYSDRQHFFVTGCHSHHIYHKQVYDNCHIQHTPAGVVVFHYGFIKGFGEKLPYDHYGYKYYELNCKVGIVAACCAERHCSCRCFCYGYKKYCRKEVKNRLLPLILCHIYGICTAYNKSRHREKEVKILGAAVCVQPVASCRKCCC